MHAVLFRFRADLRTRWKGWCSVALLVGLGAGMVMAAVAGARRTESANDRFLSEQRAFDVLVLPTVCPEGIRPVPEPVECDVSTVLDHEQVADAAVVDVAHRVLTEVYDADRDSLDPEGQTGFAEHGKVLVVGSPDGRFGDEINQMRFVEGRPPRDEALDEIAVSKALADREGLDVGDSVRPQFVPGDGRAFDDPRRIVGIEVSPAELEPPSGNYLATVRMSPALLADLKADGVRFERGYALRLRDGDRGIAALRGDIADRRVTAELVFRQRELAAAVDRAIEPQVLALVIFAVAALLAVLALLGGALARQAWAESEGYDVLSALGFARGQLVALTLVKAAIVGLLAAPVAAAVAVALSPLAPVGLARDAEPDPGVAVDGVVVGAGFVLVVVLAVLLAAWPAWRVARSATDPEAVRQRTRRSRTAGAMTSAGFPVPAVVGVRLALEPGRGRAAVPLRSGLFGVTAGALALAAAVTFGASLQHLLDSPRLFGFTWDAVAFPSIEGTPREQVGPFIRRMERVPGVDAVVEGTTLFGEGAPDPPTLGPDHVPVELLAIGPGRLTPAIVEGRAPSADDEVVLGVDTLDQLGLEIGDRLRAYGEVSADPEEDPAAGRPTSARYRIVGTAVIPPATTQVETESRYGRGIAMTVPGHIRLDPSAADDVIAYLRFVPGRAAEAYEALDVSPGAQLGSVLSRSDHAQGEGALAVGEVADIPYLFAGLIVLVAVGVLAHVLTSSTRARRRDLGVLRALGFRNRQLRSALAWQATTIAGVALLVGIPLGVVAGRWAWRRYAIDIGVVPEPVVDWLVLGVAAAGALVVANVVALWPSRAATRVDPAAALRAE